jgi:hypothetical protein
MAAEAVDRARRLAKQKASRNATRHGLSAKCHLNSDVFGQIELIMNAICGDDPNPSLREEARTIAQTAVMLHCVQIQNLAAFKRIQGVVPETTGGMREAVGELTRFTRYERRAWSSQEKVMRDSACSREGRAASRARQMTSHCCKSRSLSVALSTRGKASS